MDIFLSNTQCQSVNKFPLCFSLDNIIFCEGMNSIMRSQSTHEIISGKDTITIHQGRRSQPSTLEILLHLHKSIIIKINLLFQVKLPGMKSVLYFVGLACILPGGYAFQFMSNFKVTPPKDLVMDEKVKEKFGNKSKLLKMSKKRLTVLLINHFCHRAMKNSSYVR